MATCRGIDVSVYQGPQDWAAHKADGVVFAIAKASEGMRTRDKHFAQHITAIKAAGLVPGAYHFAWPNQDVAKEAANYIDAVKPYAGAGFVHWLDLERRSDGANYRGRSNAQIHDWAAQWVDLVQKAFPGQRVGSYTSGDDIAKGHLPAGVPLWYPAYPGNRVDTYAEAEHATRPAPSSRTVTIWQFTSNPAGSGPNLDLNLCYMSEADLRTWAGVTKPTPKPRVSLTHVIAAAHHDPGAAQGHGLHKTDVKPVEQALKAEGYLPAKYASDGTFGTLTIGAYAKWQKAYSKAHHLGWTGAAVNGIPGKTSLTALGAKHGFTVVA
jgi:GH25 family lysozyme M1 (1,4-beta-N-acetylmuramidase)